MKSDNLRDVVKKADDLIKAGQYQNAWNVLVPFKNEPAVQKRLQWLRQNRERTMQSGSLQTSASKRRPGYRLFLLGAFVVIVGLGLVALYRMSIQNVADTTSGDASANALLGPAATIVRPTENPAEVDLQQELRDWFMTVDGVENVLSLDVDVPGDQPPLIFAEIVVADGFNDTRIPDTFMHRLNEALSTTHYSDFVIIVKDEMKAVEYGLDTESLSWHQTELASVG